MASELQVTTIRGVPTGANANQILVPSGQTLHAPGHIIQTVSNSNGTAFTTTSTSYVDLMSVSITPVFSNSKILITGTMFVNHRDYYDGRMKLVFDSGSGNTDVTLGSAKAEYMVRENGHPAHGFSVSNWGSTCGLYGGIPYVLNFEHSPNTTSTVNYKVQGLTGSSTQTFFFNRGQISATDPLHISTIIVQEIAQ